MTDENTTDENEHDDEPTEEQLALALPDYHGRTPIGMTSGFNGTGNRIMSTHEIGDRLVIVVEAKVTAAGHRETDKGLVYGETYKVLDMFEAHGQPGKNLLGVMRSTYRTGRDAAEGKGPLPDMGDIGYTDASGVVLTPAEVAAIQGDPVRAMVSDQIVPVVVVYSDESRKLWPDDYPKDTPRPAMWENADDKDDAEVVTELLDAVTGEPLDAPEPEDQPDDVLSVVPDLPGEHDDGDAFDEDGD